MTTSTALTLGQAAKELGFSKATISVAIKKGRLNAEKAQDGSYQIEPCELFRVWPNRANEGQRTHGEGVDVDTSKPQDKLGLTLVNQAVLEAKLEASEKEVTSLKSQLEIAHATGENWKDQAKASQRLLEHKPENTSAPTPTPAKTSAWVYTFLGILILAVGGLVADRFGLISLLGLF